MEWLELVIDFIIHIDEHLISIVSTYGLWTYLILFLIVFCETGLVVTPFLPGDSLLFVAVVTVTALRTGAQYAGIIVKLALLNGFESRWGR